jgi:hypothetical protein
MRFGKTSCKKKCTQEKINEVFFEELLTTGIKQAEVLKITSVVLVVQDFFVVSAFAVGLFRPTSIIVDDILLTKAEFIHFTVLFWSVTHDFISWFVVFLL